MTITVEQIARYKYSEQAKKEFPIGFGGAISYGPHRVFTRDIVVDDPKAIKAAVGKVSETDLIYVDLPWGGPVTSQFRKRAGLPASTYGDFRTSFVELLKQFPEVQNIVLEMGNSWLKGWRQELEAGGFTIDAEAHGTYYRKNPMTYMIISPEAKRLKRVLDGTDDMESPGEVLKVLRSADHVIDLCCGRGTTGYWAEKNGRMFTGVELDPDRACGALFHIKKLRGEV